MGNSYSSKWLRKVCSAKSNEELMKVYDEWAEKYDDVSTYGFRLPSIMIGYISRYVDHQEGTILDAAAGTGILGENMSIIRL